MAVKATRAVLWLLPALAPLPGLAQENFLSRSQIAIAVRDSEAQISARYRVTSTQEGLVFYAPRFSGTHLSLEGPPSSARSLDTLPGLLRLELPLDTAVGTTEIEVRYRVAGNLSRLPIFVPGITTSPPRSRVVITISGLPEREVSKDRFPRLRLDSAGIWRATPDHLPSFVALLRPRAPSVPRIAEWSVLAAAVGGTLLWLVRLRNWRVD